MEEPTMTAQPVEYSSRPPSSIREFRGTLKGEDLTRFNAELDDLPLNEIAGYLKGWQQILHLRTVPEYGEALRTAGSRPATPIEDIFPEEWAATSV
jgi:hypothetical protein